jgi:cell division septation protein DedD
MVVPDQDSVLLNHDDKPKFEELLPSPEAVKPRPIAAAPAPTPAVTPPPAASSVTQTVNAPAAIAPPPASSPPASPPAAPSSSATAAAAAPPAAVAAPPAKVTPAPPASTAGSYRLQLGALKSEDAAKQEWLRLQRQQPDVLGKLALTVTRVDLGDRGIYYRIQAGPLADAAAAAQSCATLKGRNVGCILVKP